MIQYDREGVRGLSDRVEDENVGMSEKMQKAICTKVSRAVPHLSTHFAFSRLTSEFGWDPVHMAKYGR